MKIIRESLELKIIGFVIVILVVGSLTVGTSISLLVRNSLYSTAEENLDTAATIVTTNISRAMIEVVERKAEIARLIADDLKAVRGIEDIKILNLQGGEAFKKDSVATEASVMKTISEKHIPLSYKSEKSLIFYKPLENGPLCRGCHGQESVVLGAVKVAISLEKVYGKAINFLLWGTIVSVIGISVFGFFFWRILRRLVVAPIHSIEKAATSLADGDLSFSIDIKTKDEISRVSKAIKESLLSITGILHRVREVSKKVKKVAEEVEGESKKVVEGTELESEAITNIASSVEEVNTAISEIADGTKGLAASAEQTATAMEQMVSNITQVTNSAQELSSAVDSTSVSIEEMSATIRQVADNARELSAASEETLSAVEEISSSIREVEQSAKGAARLSDKVKNDASTFGMASIEKTIEGMQNIKSSVEKTADFVNKLVRRSEDIGKILNVIDDITDQTTLLSLNAAILAAQAGEHGRGFSVVADEIKDLAERTAFSTQEISTLIHAVQQEVKDAVQAMNDGLRSVEDGFRLAREAGDALRKIVESSKQSSDMAFSIEHSTTEQARAARLVSEAMERIRNMVEQIAKATSEQTRGVMLIVKTSEKMKDVSNQVKVATGEQSASSRQISKAVELVSEKSQQISRAINEQKIVSDQIEDSIEKIKDIPKDNRELAFRLNHLLKELLKDSELVVTEMERFKLFEEKG